VKDGCCVAAGALAAAQAAAATCPAHPRPHYAVAQLLKHQEAFREALAALEFSLRLEPAANAEQVARCVGACESMGALHACWQC
jgi:hypothetical protein